MKTSRAIRAPRQKGGLRPSGHGVPPPAHRGAFPSIPLPRSSSKAPSDSLAPSRKPLLVVPRGKFPRVPEESPKFRLPDVEADRALLRKMALEFLADGIVPSAFSFDEIEKMINEQGIVPGEDEFLWEGLARLVEVLREVKREN